ncbi:hypothetical protein AB0J72_56605 [Dactylosporangium sp. NPDC049742]|uniref:hypothetical protein n=1 Tax=Dactylosporangium sp. NPDC049742 TaxID=3154737 RepID=UPI00344882ED
MSSRSGVVVAVDIGTARMKVAYAGSDGAVHVVRFDGDGWTPSAILVEPDGSLVTGPAASRRAVHRPEGLVADPMSRLTADTVDAGGPRCAPRCSGSVQTTRSWSPRRSRWAGTCSLVVPS